MLLEDIEQGKEYRLKTSIGAIGYMYGDGDPLCITIDKGTIVHVNKVVNDLWASNGDWSHTIIVGLDADSFDNDGDEVEVNYSGLVSADYLEEVVVE